MSLLWENDHPDANAQDVQIIMKIIMIAGFWWHFQIINVHTRTWTTHSNSNYNDNANVQDLDDTFKGEEDQFELKDANEDVAEMVKAVNDSLHQVGDLIVTWLDAQILSNRFWKVLTGFTFIGIFELLFVSRQWFKKAKSKVVPHTIKRSTTVHQLISVEIWIKISPLDQVLSWY